MNSRQINVEAVFTSVLDYVINRIAAPSSLEPLDTVYYSPLRFMTGDGYGTHHCVLYDMGWSSLAER